MSGARYVIGDCFDVLAGLEAATVDLVFTSPPFLALRSYLPADHPDKARELGSEATPGEYLDRLLDVVEACARVLAPHGSLVFELGDTYAGGGGTVESREHRPEREGTSADGGARVVPLKDGCGWPLDKSKVLIPQLFAISLAYGFNPLTGRTTDPWRIRNTVAWCRPNPPVGRDGDKFRPATSFLTVATKARDRYWDGDAVRVPHVRDGHRMISEKAASDLSGPPGNPFTRRDAGEQMQVNPVGAPLLDWWEIPGEEGPPRPKQRERALQKNTDNGGNRGDHGQAFYNTGNPNGPPMLDWWEIPTAPYKGSHYATYPPQLVVPIVKSMCPAKVCRVCGKPSTRMVSEPTYEPSASYRGGVLVADAKRVADGANQWRSEGGAQASVVRTVETLGFTDCGHDDYRPGHVLDPFGGSGTTGAVATGHGYDCTLIDLDERNAELAAARIGMFVTIERHTDHTPAPAWPVTVPGP